MTLAEKIWGSSIGAFIAYGKTAAAAALKPLLVTDNGDGTGTLVVSTSSSALPTGAATSANQTTGNASLSAIENETHLRDLGSAVHLSGNASSQSVAIRRCWKAWESRWISEMECRYILPHDSGNVSPPEGHTNR